MPTYTYKCPECETINERVAIPYELRDTCIVQCKVCGELCARVMHPVTFQVKETNSMTSSKPDSYWANAEANKQRDIAKRQADEKERMTYDPEYREKKTKKHVVDDDED